MVICHLVCWQISSKYNLRLRTDFLQAMISLVGKNFEKCIDENAESVSLYLRGLIAFLQNPHRKSNAVIPVRAIQASIYRVAMFHQFSYGWVALFFSNILRSVPIIHLNLSSTEKLFWPRWNSVGQHYCCRLFFLTLSFIQVLHQQP